MLISSLCIRAYFESRVKILEHILFPPIKLWKKLKILSRIYEWDMFS